MGRRTSSRTPGDEASRSESAIASVYESITGETFRLELAWYGALAGAAAAGAASIIGGFLVSLTTAGVAPFWIGSILATVAVLLGINVARVRE